MWTPIFSAYLESLAFIGRFVPFGRRTRGLVRHIPNLSYRPDSRLRAHRFDVWLPKEGSGPWPLLMYVHGGGFSLGSKNSHWWMAAHLAAQGFCVAIINYRLAPRHRHPVALEDVAAAWRHLGAHAETFGADASRCALMGESAGANLVLALTLALAADEPPAWLGDKPNLTLRAVLPAAGLLDVAEPDRFLHTEPKVHPAVMSRIRNVCREILAPEADGREEAHAWASPLRLLEAAREGTPRFAQLPAVSIGVGGQDPILDDSVRLACALDARKSEHALHIYPDSGHAFFAWPTHKHTQAFWREATAFLHAQLGTSGSPSQRQVVPLPTARRSQ